MNTNTVSRPRSVDYRHPWPVRIWHWTNALAFLVSFVTGLLIFDIHPRLYWGDDGHEGMPAIVALSGTHLDRPVPETELQVGPWRWNVTGVLGAVLDAGDSGKYLLVAMPPADWEFGATRGWHFLSAWIFGLGLPAYALYLVVSGRLRHRMMPRRAELALRSVAGEAWRHVRLQRARGEAARHYNVLQKTTYLVVLFVVLPVLVLTGLTMSNAMTAAFPDLLSLFGGRQSARSIHFFAATLLALFLLVHLFEVCVSGFVNLMRSMITGRYVIEQEESR